MSRNFGLGTRDMAAAGRIALDTARASGDVSFSTVATVAQRWSQFATYVKEQGVGRMERITPKMAQDYGRGLAEQVRKGELSAATAQNLVSAINSVMRLASRGAWHSVKPVNDCGIEKRCAIRESAPAALDRGTYAAALQSTREALGDRAAAIVELNRELGLRAKEASLLDANKAVKEAETRGVVSIRDGTKNHRPRVVSITSPRQLDALRTAARTQGEGRNLIPSRQSWAAWQAGELRATREHIQACTGESLRDLRSAYACERYAVLTGHAAPAAGGTITSAKADREARMVISAELGHGRIDVVAEYIGGRR